MLIKPKTTIRTEYGDIEWFSIDKGVKDTFNSLFFLISTQKHVIQKARLDSKEGMKIAGRNTNNLRYTYGTILLADNSNDLKWLLEKVKRK